ncbi:MAG: hypothetical protein AB7S48_12395 [Bacteroidales bacterium]
MQIKNKYIYSLVFLLPAFSLFGQQETKTFYIDSLNQLYVSPTAPVNIYVGTKADGSDAIKMVGTDKKGDPLYWNGHGPIKMTHLDLYLGRKIRFGLFADGIPPESKLLFNKAEQAKIDETIYLSGGSVIEINATDQDAGLNKTFYSVNGEPYKEYNDPIVFDKEGAYELRVYSVDNIGNKEEEVVRKFIIDSTPPISTLSTEGDRYEDILSGRSLIQITATDSFGVKDIRYSIDSSEFKIYTKEIQTARIKEGEHSVQWFATDKVGNKESIQTFTFFVDKTPPMVFEEILGNSYMIGNKEFSSGRSQLKVAAVDNKSGIKEIYYSLNNGEFNKYIKPVVLSDIMGTMNVKSYAVDNVNNRSQSGASSESFTMPTIDITGPTLTYKLNGPRLIQHDTLWIGPSTKIQINANDQEAGVNRIVYVINNSSESEYSEPFSIEQNGYFLIKCTGFDNVDNINFLSFELGVDNTAPEIFTHYSVPPYKKIEEYGETIPIYTSDLKIYLGATDNVSGDINLTYSIDGGNPVNYKAPIEKFKSRTTYSIIITATDKLGNKTQQESKFRIE